MIVPSSPPSTPSSPACGLRPATASRGAAMEKSRFSAARMMSAVSTMAAVVMARGTSASGMWIVSGTTRSSSLASIITARGAPVSAWRNSVCPGWGKPAAANTALLIGAVTMAAASPAIASATAVSMASTIAAAFAASGWPGMRWARALVASASPPKPQAENTSGSPISLSGWLPTLPFSAL
ncbi:MAG: hypothetical protein WDM86_16115 [Rhizomicrobium sp.]